MYNLWPDIVMDMEEMLEEGYWGRGGWRVLALDSTGIITQEAEPGYMVLVDSHNEFNDLIFLSIMWMVRHH